MNASTSVNTDEALRPTDTETQADPGNLKRFGVMPHFGDLGTLVERRTIRVLTVFGPGRYLPENGPRGPVHEYAQKLQKTINTKYETGLLTAQVVVVPVSRDQLFPALKAGYAISSWRGRPSPIAGENESIQPPCE